MRVQVYWNLHKDCWSVVALEGDRKGRVVTHADKVLLKDATFAVQPAGREKVRREKRKNVHAFVRGEWLSALSQGTGRRSVMYNPYKFDTFVFADNQEAVFSAKSVALLGPRNVVAEV
jgi:hypothetical protein